MGTPNLSGQYSGPIAIAVLAAFGPPEMKGKTQAYSMPRVDSTSDVTTLKLDFDSKVAILEDGRLVPSFTAPMPSAYVNYTARSDQNGDSNVLTFEPDPDNAGNYVVHYHWKVEPQSPEAPSTEADTTITLEITELKDGSLAIVTAMGANGIPGTPLPPDFPPVGPSPDWRGLLKKI